MGLTIGPVHLLGDDTATTVTVDGPAITAVRPHDGERCDLDGADGLLIPGLWDHHVHLMAVGAAAASVDVSPAAVGDRDGFAAALSEPGSGWVRAVGYHESVAGPLDARALDDIASGRPARVQHRTGACWTLNGAALAETGLDQLDHPGVERDSSGRPTGRLFRLDHEISARTPPVEVDLADLSTSLVSRGVVGVTDCDPARAPSAQADLIEAAQSGRFLPRLRLMSPAATALGPAAVGEVKVMMDDDRLPALDALTRRIDAATARGVGVAFHAVTRVQAAVVLAALAQVRARPSVRIEHGSVLGRDMDAGLVAHNVVVVSNPGFLFDRGDAYLTDVEAADRGDLYRIRSLIEAGVGVAAGTDAPYGPLDPWMSIAAAAERRTRTGAIVGPDEAVDERTALEMFLGRPDRPAELRRVEEGQPADLCLLSPDHTLAEPAIAATIISGQIAFA